MWFGNVLNIDGLIIIIIIHISHYETSITHLYNFIKKVCIIFFPQIHAQYLFLLLDNSGSVSAKQ